MEIKDFTERFNLLTVDRMKFSKRTGIPYTTISNIQKGTEPKVGVVMKILEAFPNLSAEWLLRGIKPIRKDMDSDEVIMLKDELSRLSAKYEILEEMYCKKSMELQTLKERIDNGERQ